MAILLTMFSVTYPTQLMALPEDLAKESAALSKMLSDGYAKFYPEQSQMVEISGYPSLGFKSGVAVLMSMGGWAGGNTNNQYVAVYGINADLKLGKAPNQYRLISFKRVGGKGDRLFTTLSYENQALVLSGFGYGENDGLCCPSLPINLTLTIGDRGDLKESLNSTTQ
ncbi:hypothetical protein AM1_0797 [Acaryochloris marina MBIC11017]|uniref:Uncharacterized protein n=1 Tax=Acaryochloris marina (strain MBIC 11017) TaxID=329726 RepID=B0CFF4_ACAM1|nr:hypothetical protein AM1_0797 [Acaryochloris marina MBIC11017]BDM80705.1 hypothetical protein AM10699_35730 [Acaryochloris marina MBIC10699]